MFQFTRRYFRHSASSAVIALALCCTLQRPALAQQKTYTFNIPAESTAQALMDFSRQGNVQILFPYDAVVNHSSSALAGQYDRDTALKLILDGSGLGVAQETDAVIILKIIDAKNRNQASLDAGAATEVVVTGSHIRGGSPTSPVHIITRDDIDQSGYSQVGDLVRSLPENADTSRGRTIVSGTLGATSGSGEETMNLRGIGPDATLVLVDGHRLAADESSPAPDISMIPLAALERVEIVTDGASALYGSDAVAGVANFILRKDYSGTEVSAELGGATQGGGSEQSYNVMTGNAWQTGHLLGGAEWSDQKPIFASQREFTSLMEPQNSLQDGRDKTSLFVNGKQDLSDWASVHLDGLYTKRESDLTVKTSAASDTIQSNLNVWSSMLAPGMTFKLPAEWSLSVDGTLSRSMDSEGSVYSPSGAVYLFNYRNSTNSLEVNANGVLLQLPGGPLKAAFGGGYREESFRYWPLAGSGYDDDRNVSYFYGELFAPLVAPSDERFGLNRLELSIAGRVEDYNDFGRTANPKFGVRYVPVPGLSIRSTWGTSFKAPSFVQLATPSQLYLFNGAVLGGSPSGQALISIGGNPDLKPEKSRSSTIGIDWQPPQMRSLKVSATYFNIDYTDRVVSPISATGQALSNAIFAPFVTQNPTAGQQAQYMAASSVFGNYSGVAYVPANVIAYVEDRDVNATQQKIRGVDLSVTKSFETTLGNIGLLSNATWLDIGQKLIPTLPETELTGTLSYPAKLRNRSGATWSLDGYRANVMADYVSGETDVNVSPTAKIASWTTLDLNVGYRFGSGVSALSGLDVALSVTNALDKNPPFARGAAYQTTGLYFDSANASVIGRFIALTVRKQF